MANILSEDDPLQTLGKFGNTGSSIQDGFLDGYDYNPNDATQSFKFSLSSKSTAETVQYGGANLRNNSKVKPWIGSPLRHPDNKGKHYDKNSGKLSVVNASHYEGAVGDLFALYGIRFNKTENVLRKFLRDDEGNLRGILAKGTWFLEWSRSGRWLNESNTFGGVDNLGPNKKTKIRTPNIKLRYSSRKNPMG